MPRRVPHPMRYSALDEEVRAKDYVFWGADRWLALGESLSEGSPGDRKQHGNVRTHTPFVPTLWCRSLDIPLLYQLSLYPCPYADCPRTLTRRQTSGGIYIYIYICMYIYIYIYVFRYLCIYIYIYIYIFVFFLHHMCVYIYIYMYVQLGPEGYDVSMTSLNSGIGVGGRPLSERIYMYTIHIHTYTSYKTYIYIYI